MRRGAEKKRSAEFAIRPFRRSAVYWAVVGLCLFTLPTIARGQDLRSPLRITEGSSGELIVSDNQLQAIFALHRKSLKTLWTFSVAGIPSGVAAWNDLLFVGNTSTHNVTVYRLDKAPKGPGMQPAFLYNLGLTPEGELGSIQNPADITVDSTRELVFVLDGGEKKVKVFDVRGNFTQAIPQDGAVPLAYPAAIAIDEIRQEVLVSDFGDLDASSSRVMIYDYNGNYLDQIAVEQVPTDFQFPRPQGLAVDGGRIFLVDALLGKVFVFDRNTHAGLFALGSFGLEAGQLKYPLDVVIDGKSGDVFVTNNTAGRVEAFWGAGRTK